jgi:hypothetical protein
VVVYVAKIEYVTAAPVNEPNDAGQVPNATLPRLQPPLPPVA